MSHDRLGSELHALSSLTDPSRRAFYEYVRSQRHPVGRDEAAAAVGLSRQLAAYHLDRLADSGLLDVRYARPPGRRGPGAGRPAKLYSRPAGAVEASVPARDYKLAALIFGEALAADPSVQAALLPVARRVGRELAQGRAEHTSRDAPRAERPSAPAAGGEPGAALTTLASLGYEPYVEEPGTFRLRNCPFDALVDQHRELACTMNLGLIEGVLDAAGVEGYRACLDPGEGRCCVAVARDPAGRDEGVELLSEDERQDLQQVARRVAAASGVASDAGAAAERVAARLVSECGETYLSARVSGLCREGALEVFAEACIAALGERKPGAESAPVD